ncbi:MAG: MBG domain-containing protein [Burkholderiales bacterium]|nr:MBG domain-containing protein [Burkholderiales bacterium]
MNKSYRLIYNEITNTWVAVAETVKGRGKRTSGAVLLAAASAVLGVAPAFAAPPNPPAATQLPTGGKVVAGQAGIVQNAATLNVNQTSNRAAIDWATFNVGSQAQVNFNQPSVSSVTLNRVLDANPSQIFGKISAPGQVFLTNPNGVYFAPGASVDVGGLVATTHSISNEDFMAGGNSFTRNGATGSVINEGNITASLGGYIALLAPEVRNQGVIVAQLGTVALAAGEVFELQFDGNNTLANIRVTPSAIAALVDNGSAVQAPGGLIILSAQALNRLQGGVVNNSGSLEASGLVDNGGTIRLQASDRITHSGSINVDAAAHSAGKGGEATLIADLGNADSTTQINGSISARGGNLGGDGGFIETSAGRVKIGEAARFDTSAAQGNTGTWLIDPVDFTIAATGGDMTGAALTSALDPTTGGNVTIQSSTGASGTAGDINVNDVVSWSANKLTLNAQNNININANMNAAGSASLALVFGQGAAAVDNTSNIITASNAAVNLPAGTTNFTTLQGSNGVVKNYTVITSLGVAGSTTTTDLQGINGDLTGNYALGANIDASATSSWNSTAGFAPIGNVFPNRFSGSFDGLGHTINHLTINLPTTNNVGLFGYAMGTAVIRNVGLVGGGVTGQELVGGLLGFNYYGTISNSYATGTVVGTTRVGGLVGSNSAGVISNSYATGSVRGASYVGGLAGASSGSITNSYATGPVVGTTYVGGLAGSSSHRITNSYATGSVSGESLVGGLVGSQQYSFARISTSYATGTVTGTNDVGGLVGASTGSITNSYATGKVTGDPSSAGGLVGVNSGSISKSFYDTTTTGQSQGSGGVDDVPGTVWGMSSVAMSNKANFTNWTFTTTPGTSNAWVIVDVDGSLNNAGAKAGATFPMLASEYSTTINNAHQLQLMAMNLAGSYTLGANINAANTNTASALNDVWSTSGGFVPVMNASTEFTGSFDGLGHTISNLTINLPTTDYVGLFGATGSTAVIQNVGLVDASVRGRNSVGGLVGANDFGTISNSYATGTVSGSHAVGGLVGYNDGSITKSYATGSVSGEEIVGGLVGSDVDGSITNSYATGSVTGTGSGLFLGGLVGELFRGTISTSYASGLVTGTAPEGGLVGFSVTGPTNNSFWDTQTSGQSSSAGGTGLSTADMKTQANFTSATTANGRVNPGWDFSTIWKIDPSKNNGYPYLAWQSFTPAYLRLITGSSTYGDTPGFRYALYTASSGGTVISNASPSGSVIWSAPLSNTSDAGSYAENYRGGISLGNSAYSLNAGSDVNWTIDKAPLGIALTGTYSGSTTITPSAITVTGLKNSDTLTALGSATVSNANVANNSSNYVTAISIATGTANLDNYAITVARNATAGTSTTNTASITPKALTMSGLLVPASKVYDGTTTAIVSGTAALASSEAAGTGTSSDGQPYIGDVVSVTGTAVGTYNGAHVTGDNAGTSVTFGGLALNNDNYTLTIQGPAAATITAKTLTSSATITPVAKPYDGNLAATGSTVSGSLTGMVDTDAYTLNTSAVSLAFSDAHVATANKTIGATGNVALGTLTSSGSGTKTGSDTNNRVVSVASDYVLAAQPSISSVAGTITKAALSVTANTDSKTYDGGAYLGGNGVSYSGFVNSETSSVLGGTLAYAGSSQGATNAGSYVTTPQGLTSSNYTVSFVDGTLTINKAHLTVSADPKSRIYGAANPSFTETISGFVNGEVLATSGVTGTATGSSTASATTGAGSATITASSTGLSAANYDFTNLVNGSLTISQRPITVTADGKSKTYGDANPALTYTVAADGVGSSRGLVHGDTLSGAPSTAATASSGVGSYSISASALSNGNYLITANDGTLTINKAHLTVTANDASRIVGQANPVFTATLSGFVNNETPLGAGIGGSAALSTLANAATPASKLPITVAQGSLAARNYDFTVFKDGTLTVKDLFVPPPPTAWRRDLPPASDGVGDEDEDGNDEDTLSSLDSHVVP